MEQIIEAFGIDVRLIIIQIVNFFILMAALGYFLYNPILNMLKSREDKIKEGIENAEAAAQARANAEEEKKAVLTTAHASAKEIADRAKASADETTATLLATAKQKASEVHADALLKAEQLRLKIQKETEAEIAKTALLATEKILRERNT